MITSKMEASSFYPYSIAGGIGALFTQPIWNYKNMRQLKEKKIDWRINKLAFVRALWSGVTLSALSASFTVGIRGPLFNAFAEQMGGDKPSELQKSIAASLTGICIAPVNTVIDNINLEKSTEARLNIHNKEYVSSYKKSIVSMYRLHGLDAFAKGLRYTLYRDAPFSVGLLYLSDLFSKKINSEIHDTFSSNILGGLSAGFVISTVTHPLDTMKTRIQRNLPIEWNAKSLMQGWAWRTTACTIMVCVFRVVKEILEAKSNKT